MKNFIITLLSGLALSLSGFALAGGAVVEAPTPEENPAAQVAPVTETEEVADTDADADKCDAETADCDKEETAAAPEATDSPAQVAPIEETTAS